MTYIGIKGGKKICGDVILQGSKNAVLPMIAAGLLIRGTTVIKNCPDITDVWEMLEELKENGADYSFSGHTLILDCSEINGCGCRRETVSKTRGSVLYLGALLGRCGEAGIAYPGGCVIGKRPIDLHCEMLRKMGILITEKEDALYASGKPQGAMLSLSFPSVGATENVILAAVCANGTTVLRGAATEPEIEELCCFLNEAGAKISGIGTKELCIEGVGGLHDVCHTLTGDRIVAGTLLCAAAATGGRISIYGTKGVSLNGFMLPLMKTGLFIQQQENRINAAGIGKVLPVDVLVTSPYPGFPTDMQSIMMALLTLSGGENRIYETIFESRFKIVPELCRMGAQIEISGNCAVIHKTAKLHGAKVQAEELRGGAALLLAGLAAEGETVVSGYDYIARGYENICDVFRGLGAEIVQLEEEEQKDGRG